MPVISVRIPQLGEGLQEALLVDFLKKPGDMVKRDEPIYVMETDKATTDVESPYEGRLVEWTVETGSVLAIGTEIARMEVAEGVREMAAGHGPPGDHQATTTSARPAAAPPETESAKPAAGSAVRRAAVAIPPRTRQYLKEKGLLDQADQIPAAGSKLMPDDVDRYLASRSAAPAATAPAATEAASSSADFEQVALPQSQIVLNYRLSRGTQVCVPVTVMNEISWRALESARHSVRDLGGPTGFAMACWCTVQAMKKHNKFRSTMSADGKSLRVYRRINLGVAVALPGDEMVTAVIRNADQLNQSQFFEAYKRQVETARNGKDQADESTTITISNIGKAGMRIGIAAIVAPAVATLAFGEVYSHPLPVQNGFVFEPMVVATLSFDHRIVNGVGAANFMNDIKREIEGFRLI